MKEASPANEEFATFCKKREGLISTLFIDNIRLYNRPVWANSGNDAEWVAYLLTYNDLLKLCETFPYNKFIIFTSHEDTPIDEHIEGRLPPNVLGVHATNAVYNNKQIVPFPYGLQRPLGDNDHRLDIMKEEIGVQIEPTKLLYVNCGLGGERNAKERAYLPAFDGLPWTTCRFDKDSKFFPYEKYRDFLDEMRNHKFMICPQGHGIDCHRNWELLYMRRVPVMKDCQYFRRLMKGWPVLFVDKWEEVTEELLIASEHLYEQAQTMDLSKLDLKVLYQEIVDSYRK